MLVGEVEVAVAVLVVVVLAVVVAVVVVFTVVYEKGNCPSLTPETGLKVALVTVPDSMGGEQELHIFLQLLPSFERQRRNVKHVTCPANSS